MAQETTYLELSEEGGSSHKFYEVKIDGPEVTIRFGRIGDQGQLKTTKYSDEAKALADAQKKINEKLRKGYERAVRGERKKRLVTRRSALLTQVASPGSARSAPASKLAPVLWKFDSGANAFGVFVDESLCWVANEAGKIFALDHSAQVRASFKLSEGVKCIVADDDWLYAGCDDGKVYDLTSKLPLVAYEIAEDVDILWLDISDGVLAVSDSAGSVTVINHEDESQWRKKSAGDRGWMVRCDEIGVYHGHGRGVTMYDWEDGRVIWHQPTDGAVLFGWQEEATVYACTTSCKVHAFSKRGEAGPVYQCDAVLFSCAAAENGKFVFAGDNQSNIYCFDETGKRLWKLASGCGAAYSMQFRDDRLYIVTTMGHLACIDASESAIKAAQEGAVPVAQVIEAPQVAETASAIETTSDARGGIVVECFREGGNLRVRVVS
jgi:predicted DNA-binding WGR domain protein